MNKQNKNSDLRKRAEEAKKQIEELFRQTRRFIDAIKRTKPIYDKEKDISYCPFCFDERNLERTDLNDFTHYPKCIYLEYVKEEASRQTA